MNNNCVVKIAISSATDYYHIDEVVYYKSAMSPDFVTRWLWYFEYLAAIVKSKNPRCKVELYHGPTDIKLGNEWHECRRKALLKSRTIKLKQLRRMEIDEDLFGFNRVDNENKIRKIEKEIYMLEHDEYPIEEFPEYINKIKKFL